MKKVLITGGNSGFGYSMTLTFARNGYKVFATTRDLKKEGVIEINEIAKRENLKIEWLVLDVTSNKQIEDAVKVVEKEGLDILINNAGFGVLGPIQDYRLEDVQKQFDTNFFGMVRMVYAFLPLILKSKSGMIINISSIAGLVVAPAYGIYAASKFAVEAFTESLKYELSSTGVRVCLIEPGGFETNFGAKAAEIKNEVASKDVNWYGKLKNLRDKVVGGARKGRDPQKVADRVFAITQKENPKLRNLVGSDALFEAFVRKIVPGRLWEWVMVKAVKMGSK